MANKGKVVLGTVFGAVAGFVTGVLLAPKSGKETRQDIKNTALKTKDAVVDEAEKAKDATVRKANELKNKAEDAVEDVKETVVGLKDRAERAVGSAKKEFNKKPAKKK